MLDFPRGRRRRHTRWQLADDTMRVIVRPFGDLRKFFRKGEEWREVEVPEGTTIRQLLERLGVDYGEFWRASIREMLVDDDTVLRDGDEALLFPPVAGGG